MGSHRVGHDCMIKHRQCICSNAILSYHSTLSFPTIYKSQFSTLRFPCSNFCVVSLLGDPDTALKSDNTKRTSPQLRWQICLFQLYRKGNLFEDVTVSLFNRSHCLKWINIIFSKFPYYTGWIIPIHLTFPHRLSLLHSAHFTGLPGSPKCAEGFCNLRQTFQHAAVHVCDNSDIFTSYEKCETCWCKGKIILMGRKGTLPFIFLY